MTDRLAPRIADLTGRTPLWQTSLRVLIALVLAMISLPFLSTAASAAPVNGIDIDGNRSTTDGVNDWSTLVEGVDARYVHVLDPDPADGLDDDDIFQSSKEEGDPPSEWSLRDGSPDTGGDVVEVYAYHEIDDITGHVRFYFGFLRAEDGVGAFVVELNQGPNSAEGMPVRTVGDVRITFTQDSGNAMFTNLGASKWSGAGWAAAPEIESNYDSATGESGLFGEMVVDLTASQLQPTCADGFTAVNVRSRSSSQETASLKEYVKGLGVDIAPRCRAIRVEKYDATTDLPLTGASFRLYRDDGDGAFDFGATQTGPTADSPVGAAVPANVGDGGNTHTWGNLAWGLYFVQETGRPRGYEVDGGVNAAGVKPVTLDASTPNGTAVVLFNNPQTKAQIRVSKYDASNANAPLAGAKFKLYKSDGDNTFEPNTGDTQVGTEVTADEGTVPANNTYTWTDMDYGTYFVEESGRPAGYDVDPDATGGAKTVTLRPADAGSAVPVAFYNPQYAPQIVVRKYDATSNNAPLQGASFQLFADTNNSDTLDSGDLPVGNAVPADQGPYENTYTWSTGLSWGDYFVQETGRPAGYGVDPTASTSPVGFESAKPVTVSLASNNGLATVDFNNPRMTAQIQVVKKDLNGLGALPGASFTLYKDSGSAPGVWDAGDSVIGSEVPADEGDDDNTYTWSALDWGDYIVRETVAPTGYGADASADANGGKPVTIGAAQAGTTVTKDFYNLKTTPVPTSGTIVVTKTDADTGLPIDGATFRLYEDLNGNGVGDGGEEIQTIPIHTVGTGVYTWTGLPDRVYLVKEATPPPGYQPPSPAASATQPVTVSGTNTYRVGFANEKKPVVVVPDPTRTEIVVTKRDATTNQPIDTATFRLWEDANANGTFEAAVDDKVGNAKDTTNGVVSWVGLLEGTYFVQETVAPNGYELPANTVLTIIVDENTAGGTLSRSFYDPQKLTTIQLVKKDAVTRNELAGAVFQAYVDVNKDGTFDGGDTAIGGQQTSNANGVVSWSGLKFGHYVIREVSPPDGYGLRADTDESVVLDRNNAGGTIQRDFLDPKLGDPALGAVEVDKAAFEKNADGQWVPSDGEVEFGDLVKYEITADAYGSVLYRDVDVTDFIPGYDPEDTKSTTRASYVNGSANCGSADCAVSFNDKQQLTWSLGDMAGQERTLEFVVRMPLLPIAPVYDADGLLTETVVNIAELSWQEPENVSTQRLAAAYGNRSIRSNEVVTTIVDRPEVLDTPSAERPETVKRPGALLPDTGAPTHSALFGTLGSLCLLLGAWLMLVSRGRGYLPQR